MLGIKIKNEIMILIILLVFYSAGKMCLKHYLEDDIEVLISDNINTQELIEQMPSGAEIAQIAEVIDSEQAVEEDICVLDKTSCLIKEVSTKYGIDWKIVVAIARWETGNYKSSAFKDYNNVGGMMYWDSSKQKMRLIQYATLETGIDKFIYNLKHNYIDKGLTTIEQIQKKYCPIGINDKNNINSEWARGVSSIYNNLEE